MKPLTLEQRCKNNPHLAAQVLVLEERILNLELKNAELEGRLFTARYRREQAEKLHIDRCNELKYLEERNKTFAGMIGELQDLTYLKPITLTRKDVDALVANGRAWRSYGK